eukprot:s2021_g10.t1
MEFIGTSNDGFGKDDIEVAFGWVGGTLPSMGHIVQFAVLSATALSISRVILKPLRGPRGGGFSTTGVEQLCMEAVELPLRKTLEFQLFMPEGFWTQIVVGSHQLSSSELPGSEKLEAATFVEPCCWCWRNGAKLDVNLNRAPDLEPPSPRTNGMAWHGNLDDPLFGSSAAMDLDFSFHVLGVFFCFIF